MDQARRLTCGAGDIGIRRILRARGAVLAENSKAQCGDVKWRLDRTIGSTELGYEVSVGAERLRNALVNSPACSPHGWCRLIALG